MVVKLLLCANEKMMLFLLPRGKKTFPSKGTLTTTARVDVAKGRFFLFNREQRNIDSCRECWNSRSSWECHVVTHCQGENFWDILERRIFFIFHLLINKDLSKYVIQDQKLAVRVPRLMAETLKWLREQRTLWGLA